MGLAYYGRTYKLADASCGRMGCSFTGPGAAGACTAFEGVLSNREIQSMIKKDGLKPYFNQTAMVQYVTYAGDSWVGYDGQETLAMKEKFANSLCLGGLMIWSIDFDAEAGAKLPGDSGNEKDLVWISPDIWKQPDPKVYCQFPCTDVLPPYQGFTATTAYPLVTVTTSGHTTTIIRPPMTVSVWWISTLVVGRSTTDKTVTTGVTLLTTTTWPAFATTDSSGRVFYTSATETRKPPPPYVTLHLPNITYISGLPPRPTTSPYPTPCSKLPGICTPREEEGDEEEDNDDDDRDKGCTGDDCDSGSCGGSCGGCKSGLTCNICSGFDCIGCIGLKCLSCMGPACNICVGASCSGCRGSQCATCKGPDCLSCKKGKCGSRNCVDLQYQPGTIPDTDPDEEEGDQEDGECPWIGGPGEPGEPGDPTTPGDGDGDGNGGGDGSPSPTPTAKPIQSPDFSDPSTHIDNCYHSGQPATGENLLQAADQFCRTHDGAVLSNAVRAVVYTFGWQETHKSGLNILVRLEAKYNCRWQINKDECKRQFIASSTTATRKSSSTSGVVSGRTTVFSSR